MDSSLTIHQVSKRTGLSAYTLRYYERIGLIAPIARAAGGQRRYAATDMDWLDFLLRLRETGMPIQRMQEFARLRSEGNGTAAQRRVMLEAHLVDVVAHIAALQQSQAVLVNKIALYRQMEHSFSQQPPSAEGPPHDTKPIRTRTRQTGRN